MTKRAIHMTSSRPPYPAILSASRRTDIPAFYLDWFMAGIRNGGFEVENPYNRRKRHVPARPRDVHSIVFWSKNYGPFLRRGIGEQLARQGHHLFFNFTLNATAPDLEPHVPPLRARLQQLEELVQRFGPQTLYWRFDPLCFYRLAPAAPRRDNLDQMETIAVTAARLGIRECITSFVDLYPKVQRRARRIGIVFEDPPLDAKAAILTHMATFLRGHGIGLLTCCEKEVVSQLGLESGVRSGACIPGERLARLYGPHFHRRRDRGQRVKAGCGCNLAIDIGSYHRQPCYHDCLFCYARPMAPSKTPAVNPPEACTACKSARSH